MPLFVCDKCHAVENTACGHYWGSVGSGHRWFADPTLDRTPMCSECCPTVYCDGSSTGKGRWHGRFPKETASTELIERYGRSIFVHTAGL